MHCLIIPIIEQFIITHNHDETIKLYCTNIDRFCTFLHVPGQKITEGTVRLENRSITNKKHDSYQRLRVKTTVTRSYF